MSDDSQTLTSPAPGAGADRDQQEAVANLRRLIDVARGSRKPLIHLQHNPDPDALGSAAALQALLQRLIGAEATLAYTGRVGRVENRAMLRHLNIKIKPAYKIDYDEHDLILLVDTHPGAGTCRLPEGVVPDVVVDHHPSVHEMEGVAFPYYDPDFGSTSTMVGALFVENGIPMDRRVATALTYGIRTDTMDLSRGTSPVDEKIFREVYGASDKQILSRIERARVPQEYFVTLERGLRHAQVTDFALTTWLGEIGHSDSVAEIADLLFRLEGLRWVMVSGFSGNTLFCSLRALAGKDIRAGKVAREISDGHGGGHDTFAAAQVPMADPDQDPFEAYNAVRERFLKAVRAKKSLTRPLTVPPDARTTLS
ncbi:MAG: DHH family phosphoesterase [Planctomycetota bacterium]|nr:DHH family phosphoesterase [Planctomycetota bacterium]